MADAALDIVREFVRAEDPSLRSKGFRALGAFRSSAAVELLVDAALRDPSPEARAEAERVLAAQSLAASPALDAALERSLASNARDTYALLGRLRLLGGRPRLGLGRWSTRLYRALGLWNDTRRREGWRYWRRGTLPAILASLPAGFTSLWLLSRLSLPDSFAALIGGVFFAVLLGFAAAPWITPTQLHFDRPAGLLADALYAATGALAVVLLWIVVERTTSPTVIVLLATAPLAAAVIRAAVGLAGGMVRVEALGFLATVATAATCGIAMGWASAYLVALVAGLELDDVAAGEVYVGAAMVLAIVYAWFDTPRRALRALLHERGNGKAQEGRGTSAVSLPPNFPAAYGYATGATALVLAATVFWWAQPPRSLETDAEAAPAMPISLALKGNAETLTATTTPAQFDVAIPVRGILKIDIERRDDDERVYEVQLIRTPASANAPQPALARFVVEGTGANTWSGPLEDGRYRLSIVPSKRSNDRPQTALAAIEGRVRTRMGLVTETRSDIGVSLVLAADATAKGR
jgi:hypothetical protein